ncbi:hypothetical protein Riv7116_5456 [Rivularia sp. PCC 7116]|nr:hypothetical protein Riv7116_5456 [Rivularia sp. PCC 7116]
MTKLTVDFDSNAPIAGTEYDDIAPLVLPGYEAMHQMVLACLQAKLSFGANLLVVGARKAILARNRNIGSEESRNFSSVFCTHLKKNVVSP